MNILQAGYRWTRINSWIFSRSGSFSAGFMRTRPFFSAIFINAASSTTDILAFPALRESRPCGSRIVFSPLARTNFSRLKDKPVDLVLELSSFRFLPVCDECDFLLCNLFCLCNLLLDHCNCSQGLISTKLVHLQEMI